MIAGFASAQEVDLAISGSTLWSPKNTTASQAFTTPPLKGGTYPGFNVQYRLDNHFGLNAEGSFRYHYTLYNGYQSFRPILYDVNLMYSPPIAHKTTGDFMAGIGGETLIFYNQFATCPTGSVNCRTYENSNHFLVHFGAGIRYDLWRNFYVRPEAHWYFVPNNFEFHSDNIFRVGASIGYTFGRKPAPKRKPASAPASQ